MVAVSYTHLYNKKVANMRVPEGEKAPEKMPQIVIIVDELADLMMVCLLYTSRCV